MLFDPIKTIELSSTGGSTGSTHEFSLINPQINVLRNNNLVFGVGHSSLEGFEFKFYYDRDFKNEFVGTGQTDSFQVSGVTNPRTGVGTVGVGTTSINKIDDAIITLNYSDFNPEKLFYNVQKSGYISTADIGVYNYSQINYEDSVYSCLLYTSDAADE